MTHDYTSKGVVVHTEIMLPPHALPIELSREEQIRLVREYCSSQFVSRGMCVDFAIHDSGIPTVTMRPLDERGAWAAKSKTLRKASKRKTAI